MSKPGTGGVLDPSQLSLTMNQRVVYNRLLAQGTDQNVARQVAIAVAKGDGLTPPAGVQAAAKRGLELAPEYGGAGLTDGAKARARSMAAGNAVSPDQIKRMAAFFARHDSYAKEASPPSPGYVAWQLWGGDAGKRWAESQRDKLDKTAARQELVIKAVKDRRVTSMHRFLTKSSARLARSRERTERVQKAYQAQRSALRDRIQATIDVEKAEQMSGYHKAFADAAKAILPQGVIDTLHKRARAVAGGLGAAASRRALVADAAELDGLTKADGQKPMGAAFQHAKATGRKQDDESRKRRANEYLQENGHDKINKSGPLIADVRQEEFVDAKPKRKKNDDDSDAEREQVAMTARIVKAEDVGWKKLVWSVVYEPDTIDTHGDYMDAETIEKAAHGAMKNGIYVNREHVGEPIGAHVVESYIAPCDMSFVSNGEQVHVAKGSWVMGMQIETDELWGEVLDGTFTGFSLEGSAAVPAAA